VCARLNDLAARFVNFAGGLPVAGRILRGFAHRFPEGSIVTIRSGCAAGCKWVRHHRYVNGYWIGNYELEVQQALARLLRRGDVFYDVGANAGFYSLLAATLVGPGGKVFAFEPLPENMESIREQIEANGLANCEPVPMAVGARSGEAEFSFIPGGSANAHLGPSLSGNERSIRVRTTSLDDFLSDRPMPSLVKVDVEGAEMEVVRGASRLLRSGSKFLFELHGKKNTEKMKVVEALRGEGFVFLDLRGRPLSLPEREEHVVAVPGASARAHAAGVEK
jgi:FkbM family methyltransferase